MRLENGLQSTHLFKKTTYRMLRKLHTLEYRGALQNSATIGSDYCVCLVLKHMSDVMRICYDNNVAIKDLCKQIDDLSETIVFQKRVNRTMLVSVLKKHTQVFNYLEENRIGANTKDNNACQIWSMKCLPAFICQFMNDC